MEEPKPKVEEKEMSTTITLSNGMEFMRVPAGKFIMGSDSSTDNEKPQHIVDIPYDYWMGRFPVTREQYKVYVSVAKDYPVNLIPLQISNLG
ncbi:MAG: SUMF1/EgtB/PvdO family nonheme iron enzyme [Chloroflexi bacterium]|nr:SUMF1/EgtB/PvdO family nonheme iron enzyme [Chloroflexota bacterium]